MSRMGKACLLLASLFLIATGVARIAIETFHESLYISLALGVIFFIAAVVKDFRLYKEFFSMRTTKNGLAMGWLIVLGIIVFGCVNFLAVRYNKTWDWSAEGFNSLSEQSIKVAKNLKSDAVIVMLSRPGQGEPGQENEAKKDVQDLVRMYQNHTNKLKLEIHNVLSRPDLAQKYEFKFGAFGLFVDHNGKHLRVDQANEESLTKTLLKLTRDKKKVVYILQGHAERELEGEKPETISEFKKDLETTYDVRPLTLFQQGNKIPDDAEVVALIGPGQELLPPEMKALREYAVRGGHFLIAADPGEKHGIARVMKLFGVEYQNDFVLDMRAMVPGAGNVAALGSEYSPESEITKSMSGNPSLFLLSSSLKPAPDAPSEWKFEPLVSTNDATVATAELKQKPEISSKGPHILAMSVTGKLAEPNAKEFTAVLFGDSDVFSNQLYFKYANRDLAMNSTASLAKDEDIISIRPKQPKGTTLTVAQMPAIKILIISVLIMPFLMFVSSGVIWFRRRSA